MKGITKLTLLAVLGCAACVFGAAPLGAAEGPGTTGASYLEFPVGPASVAMGEAGTALAADPFGWLVNPALLGSARGFGAGAGHAEWILETKYENVTLHQRLNDRFILAGGFVYRHLPDIQGYDDVGRETELLTNSSYQALVALAFTPLPGLTLGVTGKYFRETLADWSAGGAGADVGAYYAWPSPRIAIGVSAQNLGADVAFDGVEEPLPTTMRGGLTAAFTVLPAIAGFRIAFDLVKPRFEEVYPSAGAELTIADVLALRAGYCGREYRQGDGLTLGGGVKLIDRIMIDYAYTPYGDLGDFHRIAVHFTMP